jgi:hypothetical protein
MKVVKIILLFVIASAFTFPPADVKLKYSFKVGDEYRWSEKSKQNIKQSVMGMEQATETSYDGESLMKVVELTSTGAKIEVSFTRMKTDVKSAAMNTSMDSEGPQDKMENKVFKSLLNKPFFLYLTTSGNVEKIEGADNLWSGLKDIGLEEQQRKVMTESLQMMLGDEALKGRFQAAFVAYPANGLKQGQKWDTDHKMVVNFAMAVKNTWSVESLTSSVANLYGEGVFSSLDKEKPFNLPGGMKAKSDLGGKQAVKSTVDAKTGWPTKQEVLAEIKGTMTLLAGGMVPQDMEIPMEIISESTYVITKK